MNHGALMRGFTESKPIKQKFYGEKGKDKKQNHSIAVFYSNVFNHGLTVIL